MLLKLKVELEDPLAVVLRPVLELKLDELLAVVWTVVPELELDELLVVVFRAVLELELEELLLLDVVGRLEVLELDELLVVFRAVVELELEEVVLLEEDDLDELLLVVVASGSTYSNTSDVIAMPLVPQELSMVFWGFL